MISVNSDESLALSYQGTSQFSKSPSSDGSLASEDRFLSLHEELYNLSKEERDCVLDIPAARTLEDLKLFTRLNTVLYIYYRNFLYICIFVCVAMKQFYMNFYNDLCFLWL